MNCKIFAIIGMALAASCASVQAPSVSPTTPPPAPTLAEQVCDSVAKYVESVGVNLNANMPNFVHKTELVECRLHDDGLTGFSMFSITGTEGGVEAGKLYQVIILRNINGQWTSMAEVPVAGFSSHEIIVWTTDSPSLVWPKGRASAPAQPGSGDL